MYVLWSYWPGQLWYCDRPGCEVNVNHRRGERKMIHKPNDVIATFFPCNIPDSLLMYDAYQIILSVPLSKDLKWGGGGGRGGDDSKAKRCYSYLFFLATFQIHCWCMTHMKLSCLYHRARTIIIVIYSTVIFTHYYLKELCVAQNFCRYSTSLEVDRRLSFFID